MNELVTITLMTIVETSESISNPGNHKMMEAVHQADPLDNSVDSLIRSKVPVTFN